MKAARRLLIAIKAMHELGPGQLGLYGIYQAGLKTGHYHRQLSSSLKRLEQLNTTSSLKIYHCLPGLPDRAAMIDLLGDQTRVIYGQADEILAGKVRLFGGQPVALNLNPSTPLRYWTEYESGNSCVDGQDIKFIWESGRFGWACRLAMAHHLSGDQRYAEAFWHNSEQFLSANPAFFGPHWASAQEVALRLIALAFCLQIFSTSPLSSPDRLEWIARSIAVHAVRIPPTLVYARSQNNNHLISEALGLYTASALLRDHPLAASWHTLGWKWLLRAFRIQIARDGNYVQHSTNYHRLMLQAALWAFTVHDHVFADESVPQEITSRISASTAWLGKLLDPQTGCEPNLGHNDGSYILPLTVCAYQDYRPVIHAAARKFLQTSPNPAGPWDDLGEWLCTPTIPAQSQTAHDLWRVSSAGEAARPPHIIQNRASDSWAYYRVAQFRSRPAHADLLQFDLWWHGLNLSQDAGTYLYNAPPPWENSLASALVHNSMVVDGQEYMLRAGRFLYLDWAQTKIIKIESDSGNHPISMTAQHDGYQKKGTLYTRKVTACIDGSWEVLDHLEGIRRVVHTARLYWLLPDWEYEIPGEPGKAEDGAIEIRLKSPYGWVRLIIGSLEHGEGKPGIAQNFQLVRAGALLHGSGEISPISGWVSPTYGVKVPALGFVFQITQPLPIKLKSTWILPRET